MTSPDLGMTYLLVSQQELAPPEQVAEVKLPGPPSVAPQSLLHGLLFYLQSNRTINVRHQTYMYSADTFSYDKKIRIATFLPLSAPFPMNTLVITLQSNKNKGPPYIELNYHLWSW